MEETNNPLQGQVTKPSLLDTFLAEQQCLTAVDRFSDMHDRGLSSEQGKYYQALLPATLPQPGQQYAFEVDLDKCTGCKSCITGCHNLNGLDGEETWRAVGLIHGENRAKTLFPAATLSDLGLKLENLEPKQPDRLAGNIQYNPARRIYFQQNITTACHHCADPSCLNGCPVNAYEKDKRTGIVKHLPDQCIGCSYCIFTCSYGVPQYNKKLGVVRKCDMCTSRLEAGEAPACVQSCPNEAINITLVNLGEVQTDPGKYFQIPSAPDPNYSKPTTRYKTTRTIPEEVVAADHAVLNPQPPEYPLVFMLVFTQMSVGTFVLLTLSRFFPQWVQPVGNFQMIQSLAGLAFGLLGLGLSLLHLGRPLYAFRAVLGFRKSWLSREVVFFSIFAKLAIAYTLLSLTPSAFGWTTLRDFLGGAAAGVGLIGVFASGMIYKTTPREWWNSGQTVLKFFLTAGILGTAWTITLLQFLYGKDSLPLSPLYLLSVVLLFALGLKTVIEGGIFRHLNDEADHPLRKTAAMLRGMFGKLVVCRFSLIFSGALLFLFSGAIVSLLGFLFLLVGECLERHLFFRAVSPPKMPGRMVTE